MDAQKKMMVGNMDVGCPSSSCECLHTVQDIASVHLEKRKETSIIPI